VCGGRERWIHWSDVELIIKREARVKAGERGGRDGRYGGLGEATTTAIRPVWERVHN
jgi:hypothetical protein